MNRYIDADKMYASYQEVCKGIPCMSCPFLNCEDNKCELESMILQQPVVDAVEVVRCKDCRFHEHEEMGMVWCSNVIGSWNEPNDYCSRGERRDDEVPD